MSSAPLPPEQLIGPYLAGELPPALADEAQRYIDAHPGRRGVIAGVRATLRGERWGELPRRDLLWAELEQRLDEAPAPRSKTIPSLARRSGAWRWLASASVAAVVLGVGLVWRTPTAPNTPTRVYRTTPGERATVRLADGSTMTLAPATTARDSAGMLFVNGEAYFDVAAHPSRAFIVATPSAVIRVLGTKFSVRQYADERTSRVVVEEGKVALDARRATSASHIVLTAGMLAQASDSGVHVTAHIDPRAYLGWTTGELVFDEVPLAEVVAELARAYGVTIRVSDTVLARQPMTIRATVTDESVTSVLDLLARAANARYTSDKQGFVFVPGRPAARRAPVKSIPHLESQYGR